jgi:alpha-1,6-mannosyltransferase
MKIVDVTEFWSERGGGVRAYLTQLLREGKARGHDVAVIAPGARDEVQALEGGRVVRLRGPAMPYDPTYHALWNPREIRAAIAREAPDVLEVSSPYVAALVATTARDIRLRSLVIHSDFIDTYARPVLSRAVGARATDTLLFPPWAALRALTARFGVTVCAGEWLATKLRDHGCARVACVPFGIRHGDLSPGLRDEALRAELLDGMGLGAGASLLAVVGRLAIEKRASKVFHALASLRAEHPLGVLVLGDGPERPALEALAKRLGLPTRFLGFVTDRGVYARHLASADALVHGCPSETFGFSVAEALASGVPVVVPDAGGASEFVDDASGERFQAEGTAVDIAVATRRLLRRPRGALSAAAFAASRRVGGAEAHFDALFALYRGRLGA